MCHVPGIPARELDVLGSLKLDSDGVSVHVTVHPCVWH